MGILILYYVVFLKSSYLYRYKILRKMRKVLLLLALAISLTGCKKEEYGPNAEPCTCKAMYLWERRYKDSIEVQSDPVPVNGDVYGNNRPRYVYIYHWDTVSSPIYNNTADYPFYCKDTFPLGYWIDTTNEFNIYSYSRQRLFCID